ncbi:MAG: hypothetical protein EON92_08595, partial [Burkholderiales bacterium]
MNHAAASAQRDLRPLGILERQQALFACIISTAIVLQLQLAYGVEWFPHDSAEYWHIAVIEKMQT